MFNPTHCGLINLNVEFVWGHTLIVIRLDLSVVTGSSRTPPKVPQICTQVQCVNVLIHPPVDPLETLVKIIIKMLS